MDIMKTEKENFTFSYGQAQKWLNMTLKYMLIAQSGELDVGWEKSLNNKIVRSLHVPVDKYILDIAEKELEVLPPEGAWSTWDYEEYETYQKDLRSEIKEKSPIEWEFTAWTDARDE
jgi:hypothetical protein